MPVVPRAQTAATKRTQVRDFKLNDFIFASVNLVESFLFGVGTILKPFAGGHADSCRAIVVGYKSTSGINSSSYLYSAFPRRNVTALRLFFILETHSQ